MEPFGVLVYGEDEGAAPGGGSYKLSLQIEWTGTVYKLFLSIQWTDEEVYKLSLPIQWQPDVYKLSLQIRWQVVAVYKLSLPIQWNYADVSSYPRASEDVRVYLTIDGVDLSGRLTDSLTIHFAKGGSTLADFSILPESGPLDPMVWHGKLVTIDIADLVGGVEMGRVRKFTGVVSNPPFEGRLRSVSFECTSDLQGAFENMPRADIDAITLGEYSDDVFNDNGDNWAYAQNRMRTRAASLWHDQYRNIQVTDWAAKATPDYTFTDAECWDSPSQLTRATRRDLLNRVRISLSYQFTRLRQRIRNVQWRNEMSQCDFITKPISMITRDMVSQAVNGNDWVLQGDIVYDAVPPAGAYRCFPFASGSPLAKWVYWGTRFVGGVGIAQDDLLATYCQGAYFTLSKRWAQNIEERDTINVIADNSIEYSGEIGIDESFDIKDDYDANEWEQTRDYVGIKSGAVKNAAGDYVYDQIDRSRMELAQRVIMMSAVVDVLGAHRKNRLEFSAPYHPLVDLSHTVRRESPYMTAQGVAEEIRHEFKFDVSGETVRAASTIITLALSRHGGTGVVTNTALDPLDVPETPVEAAQSQLIKLGYHIGGLSTSAPYDETWTGASTNWQHDSENTDPFGEDPANPLTVTYPKRFRLAMPAIEDAARSTVAAQGVKTVHVDIPQDELTLAA